MVGPYVVEQLDYPLSLDVIWVILEGGLWPFFFFLRSLPVGVLCSHLMESLVV